MMTTALGFNPCILKTVPLFSELGEDRLAVLCRWIQRRSYARHAFMLRAGEKPDGLYVILAGRAKILLDDGEGREIILSIIGPNEFFGEMALIDSRPRSATVQALLPCEVAYIPRSAYAECLQPSLGAATLMLRTVVDRLREADRKIEGLALTDVYTRVARVLLETMHEMNGQWVAEPGSEQISAMVGASREMVSRVLKKMVKSGYIRRDGRRIVLLDRTELAARASL